LGFGSTAAEDIPKAVRQMKALLNSN